MRKIFMMLIRAPQRLVLDVGQFEDREYGSLSVGQSRVVEVEMLTDYRA